MIDLVKNAKQIRDQLGPFTFLKKPSVSLDWVLMKSCDGKWYFGQWNKKSKQREGIGIFTDLRHIYEGYWLEDMCCGRGRKIFKEGSYYDGDWQNDKPHGKGIYTYFDNQLFLE